MRIKEPIQFAASPSSARDLRKFWNTYYTTNEWTVSYTDTDVLDMLQSAKTTILGIRDTEGNIVATVASCPLPGTFVQQEKELQQEVFQVTCLVLHPLFRGKGLAGWLLNWLDYHTSRHAPVIHCWLRESSGKRLPKMKIVPFSQMRTAETTFLRLSQSAHSETEELPYSVVKSLFHSIRKSDEFGFDLLYLPSESPHSTWWKVTLPEIAFCAMVIGIADTKRVRDTEHIYNVVFTCFVRIDKEGHLTSPFWNDEDSYSPYIQDCVEAAAFAQGCDIVTVTNSKTCGDPFLQRWTGWKMSERKRKLYMYNLNHSSFRNGSSLFPV
jgi:GNAT superfamily N-acetyltransferase